MGRITAITKNPTPRPNTTITTGSMAAEEAQKFTSKNEMRDVYGKKKENFIREILGKI
jgi:hypothetical protein